MTEHF